MFSLYAGQESSQYVIENSRKFAKIWFEVAKIASPKYCGVFFFKSLGHQWYHASNIDTWFTFVQHCSRIYFWNVQIWSIYPTNLPWWCYYVLSTVHWELSSDYLEASKIKQYCLFGSLSSLASVARKPHSNDFFQLIFKLDAAIISKIMEIVSFST